MTHTQVTVYSKPACVQCNATYRALDSKGIGYTVVDLAANPAALDYVKSLGYSSAPVVVAAGMDWSGFRPDKINDLEQVLQDAVHAERAERRDEAASTIDRRHAIGLQNAAYLSIYLERAQEEPRAALTPARISKIQEALEGDPHAHLTAYYDGDFAAAIWQEDDKWVYREGTQTVTDARASIDTIVWDAGSTAEFDTDLHAATYLEQTILTQCTIAETYRDSGQHATPAVRTGQLQATVHTPTVARG